MELWDVYDKAREKTGKVMKRGTPFEDEAYEVGFDDYYLVEAEVDIDTLKLQFEEVQRVRWASKNEILKLMDSDVFVPFYRNFIELLFDMRKKYGAVKEFRP